MPIRQVKGKWYWGSKGPFDSRAKAEAVAQAAYANGYREKALIRLAVSELLKYSEDQPRDSDGKWTSGGGGALSSSGASMEAHADVAEQLGRLNSKLSVGRLQDVAPEILAACDPDVLAAVIAVDNEDPPNADTLPETPEPELSEETRAIAADLADELLTDAVKTAAKVNGSVQSLADAMDGQMHGLEYEMKSSESLERKLGQAIELDGMTVEEAMADMKDVVRYSVVFPPDTFSDSVTSLIDDFTEKFIPLKSASTFAARFKEDTRGYLAGELIPGAAVNTAWMDPDTGFKFEIQFHTPESIVAKTVSHEYYAVERVLESDDPLVRPLSEKMVDLAALVDAPPGVENIPTYRYVD